MFGKLGPVCPTPFHIRTEELSVVRHMQNLMSEPELPGIVTEDRYDASLKRLKGTVPPMCGIVGYVGEGRTRRRGRGLRRLEYRGYDSAGVAIVAGGTLCVSRNAQARQSGETAGGGTVASGSLGIGHTRWATTEAQRRQRTRIPLPTAESRWSTTASSRTMWHCATRGRSAARRRRTLKSSRSCWASRSQLDCPLTEAMRVVCAGSAARSPW